MKLTNLIAIMAMLVFSLGANAGVLTLDQTTTTGTIAVSAEIELAATVTWTADALDDAGASPTDFVDLDLGTISPLSGTICTDLQSNSTGGLGDLSAIACDDTNNDLHVSVDVAGLVAVGGANTVDVSYVANVGEFGILEMCDSAPTLGSACTQASETTLGDQATFNHHLYVGMPLNGNSGAGYITEPTNIYAGDIQVSITVN